MKQFKILLLVSIAILFSTTTYADVCEDHNRTEQGTGVIVDGICVDPPELPYPPKYDCIEDSRLVQGIADCMDGTQAEDPGQYPPLKLCSPGQRLTQGTGGCIGLPNSTPVALIFVSDLNETVRETSGLAKVNGKIYTHNDSGNSNLLYEINATGDVVDTITVNGAENVDWEDLACDDTYLYIADIGNSLGDRTDLKIYKILKSDLDDGNDIVNAETIAFSYADQTIFTYDPYTTPYDAEALIVYNGQLYIFTKNWANYTTKVYSIPNEPESHVATSVSEKTLGVMVTGADIDGSGSPVALVGYTNPYDTNIPFKSMIIRLSGFTGNNFFSGSIAQHEIENSQDVGQVEAILFNAPSTFYLSAEGATVPTDPPVEIPPKLYKAEIIE